MFGRDCDKKESISMGQLRVVMSEKNPYFLKKITLKLLLYSGLIFVGFCTLVYFYQDKIIFIPTVGKVLSTPEDLSLNFTNLKLKSHENTIHAWYVPSMVNHGTVLFCHGNGGNLAHRLRTVQMWYSLGYSIMIFDYAGYGESTGEVSEKSCYDDVSTCYEWLIKKGVAKESIIAHGRSLGGGVASYIAQKHEISSLILESTFTSVADMAAHQFPWLPTSLLCRTEFPTFKRLGDYSGKLLILHSSEDQIIPYHMGLANAKMGGVELITLQGGHNQSRSTDGVYLEALKKHLRE